MWADNETSTDLLGFSVHEHLIRTLVTQESLLPVTVGVFGDWGGGKSSVLRMLQRELEAEEYEDVACLYFNGWMFEGYDDAKAALISSILMQLGEHRRFGPKIRGRVVELLWLVNFMRLATVAVKWGAAPLAAFLVSQGLIDPSTATTLAAVGVTAGAQAGGSSSGSEPATALPDGAALAADAAGVLDWQRLINAQRSPPGPLDVRTFRTKFVELLEETELRSLVIVIDDLDRCSPDRLVENLEAIKLFLAVPKTAFVIAADKWIVRHAIASRYAASGLRDTQPASEEPRDVVTDYLEKLIQVPYHLPKLSPSEIETYITLLFCQLHLEPNRRFEPIRIHCEAARKANPYLTYGARAVRDAFGADLDEELINQLQWSGAIAPALAEGLKGNPRQVKRFLNALLLRKQLSEVAGLTIRDDVLIKLMLLEYAQPGLFEDLYTWQATSAGRPEQLRALEQHARAPGDDATTADLAPGWSQERAQDWLRIEPALAEVDLRDYFWIARDRLQGTVTGLTMVPPFVRALFEQLVSGNAGDRQIAVKSAADLDEQDRAELLRLLAQQLERKPADASSADALLALDDADIAGAAQTLVEVASAIPAPQVEPNLAFELQRIAQARLELADAIALLFDRWAETDTRIGAAVQPMNDSSTLRSPVGAG